MTRLLLLLTFALWLAWPQDHHAPVLSPLPAVLLFLGGYVLLVAVTRLLSRWFVERAIRPDLGRRLARFSRLVFLSRLAIPIWFATGLLLFGWRQSVVGILSVRGWDLSQSSVGVLLGTLPPFAAWAALWWAHFPAEAAFREQSLLGQLESELPVYRPPNFRSFFVANLRMQLLFILVPVLLIVLLHDVLRIAALLAIGTRWGLSDPENPVTWLLAAGVIFLLAPEILRRVLDTEVLPNSPLRRRLEALCRRTGVRYRQILLWRTQNNMGNAAVMGFVPRFRYILLSDLLVDTMNDEQIEAVFAHELGHVVHRHMAWLFVFVLVLTLFVMAGGIWASDLMAELGLRETAAQGAVIAAAYLIELLVLFGFVSRRLERQADVFAARTIQSRQGLILDAFEPRAANHALWAPTLLLSRFKRGADAGHVGEYGAAVFGSALQRVALVNNIPIKSRSWCHGSIANRMRYLSELSTDPMRTRRFDRFMLLLYGAMVFGLFAGAAFCWATNVLP